VGDLVSTKSTIRHGEGFHLYSDFLDECGGHDVVHLELTDLPFEVASPGWISLALPVPLAVVLGLIPPREKP
jgi:hypothetical protein